MYENDGGPFTTDSALRVSKREVLGAKCGAGDQGGSSREADEKGVGLLIVQRLSVRWT